MDLQPLLEMEGAPELSSLEAQSALLTLARTLPTQKPWTSPT